MCYGRFISGFVWAMALFTTAEWKGCYGCWEQERISLLHLKYSLNNPPYMSSWSGERTNSSDDECCYWDGVSCNPATGKVAELDLGYQDESDFNSPAKPDLNASLFLPFQDLTLLSLRGYHIQGWPSFGSLEILAIWSSTMDDNFLDAVGITMMGLASLEIWNSPLGSGTFPQVCNLTRLQNLYLLEMNLTGELPQCLSNMTSLRVIDVAGNELSGDIAESPLTAISSLEQIMIPKNRFRIPLSLAPFFNHSRLKTFFGAGNKELYGDKNDHYETNQRDTPPLFLLNYLTLSSGSDDHHDGYFGSFPKFLYYQTNLQVVEISNVKMKGGVGFPWWLVSNNTNLKSLNLQNCSLSGSVQLPIHQNHRQKGLEVLDISDNEVYGSIPPHICAFLPNITYLYLSNNQLSGKIPEQLSNCSLLMWLDARNNTLSGEIPRRIWNMPQIGLVDLSSNSFSGTLPPDFISPYMQGVYLSRNKLGGSLSGGSDNHGISSVKKEYTNYDLQVLDLGHNRFTGTFPTWIVEMPRLTHLLLNDNELQGEILSPQCLGQLKLIDVSHNQLFGRLSFALTSNNMRCNTSKKDEVYFIDDLEFTTKFNRIIYKGEPLILMSGLDFSNNHFFGEIPPQIGHLGTIKALNLSYNRLTGPIPPTFSGLISIETLDISHNNLSGVIPTQLMELNYLSSFSVAYNNLSGKCPKRVGQLSTFDEDSYRGNPHLMNCTLLQSTPKPYVTQTPTDDNDGEYGGYIDMESFYTSSGVSFVLVLLTIASVLYINPYWRQVWFYYVRVTITTCYYFVVDHLPVSTRYKVWEPHV